MQKKMLAFQTEDSCYLVNIAETMQDTQQYRQVKILPLHKEQTSHLEMVQQQQKAKRLEKAWTRLAGKDILQKVKWKNRWKYDAELQIIQPAKFHKKSTGNSLLSDKRVNATRSHERPNILLYQGLLSTNQPLNEIDYLEIFFPSG